MVSPQLPKIIGSSLQDLTASDLQRLNGSDHKLRRRLPRQQQDEVRHRNSAEN